MLATDSYNHLLRIFSQAPSASTSENFLDTYSFFLKPPQDNFYQQFLFSQSQQDPLQQPSFLSQQQLFNLQQQQLFPTMQQQLSIQQHQPPANKVSATNGKRSSPNGNEVKDIFSMADMFQVTEACGGSNGYTFSSPKLHSKGGGISRKKINYFLKFGEYGTGPGQFTEPSGVCSNEAGEFLVADTNNHRIQIFNHEGEFLRQIGDGQKTDGPLVYPNRVAVCPKTGNIIVTERPPSKQVQVFTSDGAFVRRFGSNIIMHPRGLAVDQDGRIIVLESKVMRTLIYNEFGTLEHNFECPDINFANSVAVNSHHEIFITDNRSHCVKVFDYSGNLLRQIGGDGITNFPIGVNIGPNGEVLVADNHNNFNVTIFDREGNLISAVESKVKHAQCFDVTLTSDGSVVVASKDYRLYVYRFPLELFSRPVKTTTPSPHLTQHNLLTSSNSHSPLNNAFLNGNSLNFSNHLNNINIASLANNEESKRLVDVYNMLTSNLTTPSTTPFLPPNQIANGFHKPVTSSKRASPTCSEVKDIFSMADMFQVTEECGMRSLTTPKSSSSSNGGIRRKKINYFLKFGEYGTGPGQFTEPSGVCSNEAGEFLVADTNNHRIQIFNHEGEFLRQIGDDGENIKDDRGRADVLRHKGPLVYPNRVAVCPKTGNIIVTERPPSKQVQVFTADGKFVRRFGSNVIMHPRGLTVDKNGKIIVLESKVMRTLIHDEFGTLENSFDCPEVNFANSIAVNDFNEIFITDNRCHCVKVFDYNGNRLREIGGEGITNFPIGVNIGPNGEVLVADNHNNFNVTIFDREGNLISAVESKVKHAQCFDVTLTSDGSVVVASKDYRLYVYRFPLELFSRSGSTVSRSTSSSPPAISVPCNLPSNLSLAFDSVPKNVMGRRGSNENDSEPEYQQFTNVAQYLQQSQRNVFPRSKPARMITNINNGLDLQRTLENSLSTGSCSSSPFNPSDLNQDQLDKIALLNLDNCIYNKNNLNNGNFNSFHKRPQTATNLDSNTFLPSQQTLIDNFLNNNTNNIYNNFTCSNYNTTLQQQNNMAALFEQNHLLDHTNNNPSTSDYYNSPFLFKSLLD